MGKPRRNLLATVAETTNPPDHLPEGQEIARIVKTMGNSLYTVELPSEKTLLVELNARFRSAVWVKRGNYVLVDRDALADRENKLDGEIINIVREEKEWRKMPYWPKDFAKKNSMLDESEDDESTVGRMPPSDSEDD